MEGAFECKPFLSLVPLRSVVLGVPVLVAPASPQGLLKRLSSAPVCCSQFLGILKNEGLDTPCGVRVLYGLRPRVPPQTPCPLATWTLAERAIHPGSFAVPSARCSALCPSPMA